MIERDAAANPPVRISDLHDGALHAWRKQGIRDAVLVHVDAHHDADSDDWDFVTIANFVWWAVVEGIVSHVIWVVPDPSWEGASGRAELEKTLACLARQGSPASPDAAVEIHDGLMRSVVAGKPFTACRLDALPAAMRATMAAGAGRASGPVLLDVDVDYFLIPRIVEERPDPLGAWPWIWPDAFVEQLHRGGTAPAFITIATSTRGGFTPIEWMYFGDELAARLSGRDPAAFDVMRRGAEAEHADDHRSAEAHYRSVLGMTASCAGASYRLARLLAVGGRERDAHELYASLLRTDPGYRCADSAGRVRQSAGDRDGATAAYRLMLRMDPDDPYAAFGLAELAADDRRDQEAAALFERALAALPDLVDAHRGLAQVLERLNRDNEAIRHYERSIRLELSGTAALAAPLATCRRLTLDREHWRAHARLAWLQRRARLPQALASSQMALAGDPDRLDLYVLTALEHLRRRSWIRAAAQITGACRAIGRGLAVAAHGLRPWRPAFLRHEVR